MFPITYYNSFVSDINTNSEIWFHTVEHWQKVKRENRLVSYQQGVPTKVFLERCLSPASNMHADTPKSANLTAPSESIKMLPACSGTSKKHIRVKDSSVPHIDWKQVHRIRMQYTFTQQQRGSCRDKSNEMLINAQHPPPPTHKKKKQKHMQHWRRRD